MEFPDEPVLMADGTTKPIEAIKVGDEVLTRDENNPDAPAIVGKVVRVFRSMTAEGTMTFTWSSPASSPNAAADVATCEDSVTTTPGHVWYVHGRGWVHARWIRNGDVLRTADGRYVVVRHVRFDPKRVEVFNFEVEGTHTYHVGSANIWVHNVSVEQYALVRRVQALARHAGINKRWVTLAAVNVGGERWISTSSPLSARQRAAVERLLRPGERLIEGTGRRTRDARVRTHHAERVLRAEAQSRRRSLRGRSVAATNNICPTCRRQGNIRVASEGPRGIRKKCGTFR